MIVGVATGVFQAPSKAKGKGNGKGNGKGKKPGFIQLPQEFTSRWERADHQMSERFCFPCQKPPIGKGDRRKNEKGEWRCLNPRCVCVHKDIPENEMDNARVVAATLEEQKVWRKAEKERIAALPPEAEA